VVNRRGVKTWVVEGRWGLPDGGEFPVRVVLRSPTKKGARLAGREALERDALARLAANFEGQLVGRIYVMYTTSGSDLTRNER
jgi:hypothetical protein